MPRNIDRDEVQRLLSAGAQLVDTLPAEEYREQHLPGAISLPLGKIEDPQGRKVIDPKRPVIVYCWDSA